MKKINKIFEINVIYSALEHNFSEGYTFVGESHDFWELAVVLSGTAEVTCDDSVYSLVNGDIIFYPPLCFHNINRVGKNGAKILNISFSADGIIPDKIKKCIFSLSDSEIRKFEHTFHLMRHFFTTDDSNYSGQLASNRLSALILELSTERSSEERMLFSETVSSYREVVSFMRERICDNLSLSDVAAQKHISVSYIKHLFSRYAGLSPKSFYHQLRLNTAKSFLKSDVPILDIAAKMNFSSSNYFSRWFKKETGLTPSQYKKGG